MLDSLSRDEKRNVGKILVLPNSPRYNPNGQLRPQRRPDVTPFPEALQDITNRDLGRELAELMLATMPDELRAAAVVAYHSSQQAAAALNAASQEYASLSAPMTTALSGEQRSALLTRRAALESYITELRAVNAAAGDAYLVALEAARRHVQLYSGGLVYDHEQRQVREMRAEAERLEQAAEERERALSQAIALVNVWVPVEPMALVDPYQSTCCKAS
jgi:hypothetical protein